MRAILEALLAIPSVNHQVLAATLPALVTPQVEAFPPGLATLRVEVKPREEVFPPGLATLRVQVIPQKILQLL